LARWVLLLQGYDYKVEHRSGTRMKHVDALSKYPVMTIVDDFVALGFKQAQEKDEHLKAICKIIEDSDSPLTISLGPESYTR